MSRFRQNFVPGTETTAMFREHALPTNGDGFGIGWYTDQANGLADDPSTALAKMVGRVERARREHGVTEPFRASMAAANGETVYAVRYSSDRASKTRYHSQGVTTLRTVDGGEVRLPTDSHIIVSEPLELEYRAAHWVQVPEWSLVTLRAGQEPVISDFEPIE